MWRPATIILPALSAGRSLPPAALTSFVQSISMTQPSSSASGVRSPRRPRLMPQRAEEIGIQGLGDLLSLEVPDQHGQMRRLADYRGTNVVLYFYPRDHTPGCTVEGKEFRELHDQFIGLDCAVIGVSTDSVESHRAFAEKHGLPFPLLADTHGELTHAFGVLDHGM